MVLFLFRQSTWRIFCLSWWCSWWRMVWRNKPSCFPTNQVLGTSFPKSSSDLTSKSMANCSSKMPAMVCYLCLYFLLKQRTQKKNRCQMKNQAREWSSQVECDFMNCKKEKGLKNIDLMGFKPMPLYTRWVLLPAELRSHTLRARQKRLLLCSDCKPNFWELFVCHLCNTTIVGSPLMFIADHRGESSPELKNNWFRLQRECSVPVDRLWKDLFRTY